MSDLITTQDLTKRFDGLVAVDRVEFRIREGQVAGVMGPNGSGKTTLFNLLSGLFFPSAGQISFGGRISPKWILTKGWRWGWPAPFSWYPCSTH